MKEAAFLKKVRKFIKSNYTSQRHCARELEVSPETISAGLKGNDRGKPVHPKILALMGYKRIRDIVVTYERLEDEI